MSAPDPALVLPSFGDQITIGSAAACRQTLLDAVHGSRGDLRLDLAAVQDFDSAGVQLLLAARHTLHERGARLRIERASASVADALAVFGLGELLTAPANDEERLS